MANKIQKRTSLALREKTQYILTFGVIATMLLVANFPLVVIFFFGVFAYFLWKTFSQPSKQGVRDVFEFYLAANEVLRDDERRWFGFEVREVIGQGERILQMMHGAPPLVYFALGALYNKIGDHEAAANHLSYVIENDNSDESTYLHPSGDLRRYVTLLRKIERDPKEAPRTAAAIRTLERLRKNRGAAMLEDSRKRSAEAAEEPRKGIAGEAVGSGKTKSGSEESVLKGVSREGIEERNRESRKTRSRSDSHARRRNGKAGAEDDLYGERKPITEVLHDIYDKNIQ